MSGYKEALKAAGATVLEFEFFGSYQGDWLALVEYKDTLGWVHGSFGSCSYCDSFESEFGWNEDASSPEYKKKLENFGKIYLDCMWTQEQCEKYVECNMEWDSDAKDMMEFVSKNSIKLKIN